MRYISFKDSLKEYTVFSLADIKSIDADFQLRRLHEWQKKNYIKKLIKGYYIFSDLALKEEVLFEIANRMYNPSYISLECALAYYSLIPESVYGITSISTRRTYTFSTPIAAFVYKTIKPQLFFGYTLVSYDHKSFKIASPEKALIDYFYLHPEIQTWSDYQSLRIDKEMFIHRINQKKLARFLDQYDQKKLKTRITSFLECMRHA